MHMLGSIPVYLTRLAIKCRILHRNTISSNGASISVQVERYYLIPTAIRIATKNDGATLHQETSYTVMKTKPCPIAPTVDRKAPDLHLLILDPHNLARRRRRIEMDGGAIDLAALGIAGREEP